MPCPACDRVVRALAGDDPFFLADMRESVAILHKHQPYLQPAGAPPIGGWCTLWLKDHHEHLALLPRQRQVRLAEDIADLAGAMHAALPGIRRINYECLGNVVPHIHWHLIPRFDKPADPDPGATVWVRPAAELDCGVDDALRDSLVLMLQRVIKRA